MIYQLPEVSEVASPAGELESGVRVLRVISALAGGIPDVTRVDLNALCGRLRGTTGGAWALENELCDPDPALESSGGGATNPTTGSSP